MGAEDASDTDPGTQLRCAHDAVDTAACVGCLHTALERLRAKHHALAAERDALKNQVRGTIAANKALLDDLGHANAQVETSRARAMEAESTASTARDGLEKANRIQRAWALCGPAFVNLQKAIPDRVTANVMRRAIEAMDLAVAGRTS